MLPVTVSTTLPVGAANGPPCAHAGAPKTPDVQTNAKSQERSLMVLLPVVKHA
jgi:hypothetical protein